LASPVSSGEVVALVSGSPDRALAWSTPVTEVCAGPPLLSGPCSMLQNAVFSHSQNGTLAALSQRDGRLLWAWEPPPADSNASDPATQSGASSEVGGSDGLLADDGDMVILASCERRAASCTQLVRALSVRSDRASVRWERALDGAGKGCACIGAGPRQPRLARGWARFDDGSEGWSIVASSDPCTLADGQPSNGTVSAFDELGGRLRWAHALPADVRCSRAQPGLGSQLLLVCTAGSEPDATPVLLALDGAEGTRRWSLPLAPPPELGLCGSAGLGARCRVLVGTSQPALSADGVLFVLAAIVPQLFGATAPSSCALLRYATRPSLGDAASSPLLRALSAILLGGECNSDWLVDSTGARPLVRLRADGTLAVAAGRSVWLLAPRNACSDVDCGEHGVCRNGTCFCTANYLSKDCSQPYSPLRAEWPVWIGLGATVSLLCALFVCVLGVYRSFLWVKFRLQMLSVRHAMEGRGYSSHDSHDSHALSFDGGHRQRGAPFLPPQPRSDPESGSSVATGSVTSLLD